MNVKTAERFLMKAVRINKRWHVIRAWSSDAGFEVEPLADVLARNLIVRGEREPIRLADALIEAGWTPPS